jgi:hypothetical protein
MRRVVRTGVIAATALAVAGSLTACEAVSTVDRPGTPVVLTGADLPDLTGTAPGEIVAFRYSPLAGEPTWTQVPVQVDERVVVGFGSQPANNTTPGTVGTVYGNGAPGVTALQYADPSTFVGADTDATFDADDELVFMSFDLGGRRAARDGSEPTGVVPGSGVEVTVADPLAGESPDQGWLYLFESAGTLDPSAGQDYVDYTFDLVSGPYLTTYKRADGPNPETSTVVTPTYEAHFVDRWKETVWSVTAPGASGVDLLDGHKNQFVIGSCGRSNHTFADAEGAFVANIDGPVRAIRSYVGANSGPLTQRTHLMYRDRQDIVTDLRVHAIPAVMDFVDLSSGAVGATYRSSTVPAGVAIDGVNESIPAAVPDWESINGPGGHVLMRSTYEGDIANLTVQSFYRDQLSPPETQCWGDSSFYGASGASVVSSIPNTDPRDEPWSTLVSRRVVEFGSPVADPSEIGPAASAWAAGLAEDLQVSAVPLG